MIGIEPASLSTAPVGTKGGDQRVWRFVLVSDGKSTLGDNGGVDQAEWSSPSQNRAELSMDIEPLSLSTAPVGTEGGDQRVWRFVLVSDGTSTLGDNGGVGIKMNGGDPQNKKLIFKTRLWISSPIERPPVALNAMSATAGKRGARPIARCTA